MKRMCKFVFGIIFSIFAMGIISCSGQDENANLTIAVDMQSLLQKNEFKDKLARNVSDDNWKFTVTLYDVEEEKEVKTISVPVINNKASVTFEKIPLFFKGKLEASILEGETIKYKGRSEEFIVHEGRNLIDVTLKEIPNSEDPNNPTEPDNPTDEPDNPGEPDNPTDEPVIPETTVYTITYILNGGTNTPDNPENFKSSDGTIVLKSPTKIGYTFEGWYNGDEKVENIENGSTGNISLTAQWKKIEYELKITIPSYSDLDGFEINEIDSTLSVEIPDGYNIEGWYVNGQQIDSPKDSEGKEITEDITSNQLGIEEGGIYTIMIIVKESNGSKLYSAECQLKVTK